MATMARPKAQAMPSWPMTPKPASTAEPHPNKTNVNVPMNSAASFLVMDHPPASAQQLGRVAGAVRSHWLGAAQTPAPDEWHMDALADRAVPIRLQAMVLQRGDDLRSEERRVGKGWRLEQ